MEKDKYIETVLEVWEKNLQGTKTATLADRIRSFGLPLVKVPDEIQEREVCGWRLTAKAGIQYVRYMEILQNEPSSSAAKEMQLLHRMLNKCVFNFMINSDFQYIDVGSEGGMRASSITDYVRNLSTETRITYIPIDENKFTAQYSLLNLFFSTGFGTSKDPDLELLMGQGMGQFMEQLPKQHPVKCLYQGKPPVQVTKSLNEDGLAESLGLEHKLILDKFRVDLLDLTIAVSSLQENKRWRRIIGKNALRDLRDAQWENATKGLDESEYGQVETPQNPLHEYDQEINRIQQGLKSIYERIDSTVGVQKAKVSMAYSRIGQQLIRTTNKYICNMLTILNETSDEMSVGDLEEGFSNMEDLARLNAEASLQIAGPGVGIPFLIHQYLEATTRLFSNEFLGDMVERIYPETFLTMPTEGIGIGRIDPVKYINAVDLVKEMDNFIVISGQTMDRLNDLEKERLLEGISTKMSKGDYLLVFAELQTTDRWCSLAKKQREENWKKEANLGKDYWNLAPGIDLQNELGLVNVKGNVGYDAGGEVFGQFVEFKFKVNQDTLVGILERTKLKMEAYDIYVTQYRGSMGESLDSGPEYAAILLKK